MDKIALVTGATAGIGTATALSLAEMGYNIIITGRRAERLSELKAQLEKQHIKVLPLCFDVRNLEECQVALSSISEEWKQVDVLINNAGLAAGKASIDEGDFENWNRMIDTNVKGLLNVSGIVIPWMSSRKRGRVINIGSLAGKEAYANGTVYCGSKHAVDAISRGMRLDLLSKNIKVSNIAPGLVETEFSMVRFDWDAEKAANVYKGFDPLKAEDIAECIRFVVSRPAHVNIADMLILPAAQGNSVSVNRNS